MKYTVMKMDKRFAHHDLFEYCIKFSGSMSNGSGPEQFNDALVWFNDTYGWSAEIRQYDRMTRWASTVPLMVIGGRTVSTASKKPAELPKHCNAAWSWTNGYDDLRIYVKSAAELNFFQLRWPKDSK